MSRVYKRKGTDHFYADYVDIDGKRKRTSLGKHVVTKKEAEKILRSILTRIDAGKFGFAEQAESVTFESYAMKYIEQSREYNAPRTVQTNIYRLKHPLAYFGDKSLATITRLDIERYKRERRKAVSGSTVNRDLGLLKTIFNQAVKDGLIPVNPVVGVKNYREEVKRILKPTVQEEWVIAAAECAIDQYAGLVLLIAYHTGMRRNEICNLKWTDIDLSERTILVRVTKNQRPRLSYINDKLLVILSDAERFGEYVITRKDGQRIKYLDSSWKNAIARASEKYPEMGIQPFKIHDLRHTFASNLAMAGVDPMTIKELGGWRSMKMVERYVDPSREHLLASINKINEVGTNMAQNENEKKVVNFKR